MKRFITFARGAGSLRNGEDTAAAFTHPADIFGAHLQSMFLLRNAFAAAASSDGLRFRWEYYPDYNHNAVPLPQDQPADRL